MKLIGELKEKVEAVESDMEKKEIIAHAGMLLTDDELAEVSGGVIPRAEDCEKSDGLQALNDVNNPVVVDIYAAISNMSKTDEIPEHIE